MEVNGKALDVFQSYVSCHSGCFHRAKESGTVLLQPFVTLSRQTGAGGISVGEKLVQFLNKNDVESTCPWGVFDKNLVATIISEHRLSKEIEKFMPEDKRSEVQSYFEELFGLHPTDLALIRKTTETILRLANMGNAIIVGRGANIVTRKMKMGFHVRLIGSLARRIAHIQEYYQLNRDQAFKFIEKEDRGKKEYLEKYFAQNIDNNLLYDLVINTDHVSYEQVAEMIGQHILSKRQSEKERLPL